MEKEIQIPDGFEAKIEGNKVVFVPKENEDEKVRKALLRCCDDWEKGQFGCMAKEDIPAVRAWLEKQKTSEAAIRYLRENHSSEKVSDFQAAMNIAVARAYDKGVQDTLEKQKEPLTPEEKMKHPLYVEGFEAGKQVGAQYEAVFGKQKEQKPTEWDFRPYGVNETVDKLIAIAECLEMDGDCLFNGYSGTECGKFLRELARKQIGCKPVEWGEEDEKMMQYVIGSIDTNISDSNFKRIRIWFESIKDRVQPKQEWSEKDDALLKEIVSFFKDGTVKLQHDLDLYAGFLENKFKFLRPQPHWKPSKEQMEVYTDAIYFLAKHGFKDPNGILESLYNELKKQM